MEGKSQLKKKVYNNKQIDIINLILELKSNGIDDLNVLKVIERIPRFYFLDESIKNKASLNIPLPIDCGQTISQPLVVAYMTQELKLKKSHRVLEIGTGSGYQTAILASLSIFVYTIERYKTLRKYAEDKLRTFGYSNIFFEHADGGHGWENQAPFDRIIVTASAPEIPKNLTNQLSENGIMIIPIGDEHDTQFLVKIVKRQNKLTSEKLIPVRFVPLLEGKENL